MSTRDTHDTHRAAVIVRMSRAQRRKLRVLADASGVSVNTYVTALLKRAERVGFRIARVDVTAAPPIHVGGPECMCGTCATSRALAFARTLDCDCCRPFPNLCRRKTSNQKP